MTRRSGLLTLPLAFSLAAAAAPHATWFPTPLSPRIANYEMNLNWDPIAKVVSGKETIRWRNATANPTPELRFHLYQNAFASNETVFMRESGGQLRGDKHKDQEGGKDWGYEEISRLVVTFPDGQQVNLGEQIVYGAGETPDGEKLDRTVAIAPLPKPAAPGEALVIEIQFKTKLPRAFARSGFAGNYAMVSQFFPKLGVLQDSGWNCHAYHAYSEFFSDFGSYDVEIRAPRNLVIAAVGEAGTKAGDGGVWNFHAEDVHDFSFAADPGFQRLDGTWNRPAGGAVAVSVFYHEDQKADAPRNLDAAKRTLEFLEARVGSYPYPVLTVVIPGWGAGGTGGMEYPTLVTSESVPLTPGGVRLPEIVVEHEVGHQWFYGMLASNEFEEPWLDEGLNQMQEVWMLDEVYGGAVSFYGMKFNDLDEARLSYGGMPGLDPTLARSWEFATGGSYGANVYRKTAVFMNQLRRQIGDARFTAGLRNYHKLWAFKHPTSDDFIAAFSAGAGEDFRPYFDTWLRSTKSADWRIRSLTSEKVEKRTGWYFENGAWRFFHAGKPEDEAGKKDGKKKSAPAEKRKDEPAEYRTVLVLSREGQAEAPVEWEIAFQDGSLEKGVWKPDGKNWTRVEIVRSCTRKDAKKCRYQEGRLDPAGKLIADLNPLNNRKGRGDSPLPALKAGARSGQWLLFLLDFLGGAL